MESIYNSPAGKAAVLSLYERRLASITFPVESRFVDTHAGTTHLLIAGPIGAPPLVVVHGANGSAPEMAAAFGQRLAESHRLYLVDVPGEPNRSAETRLSKAGDACAHWMMDVLGALHLDRVAMLGMSGGGFVTLRCCASMPERIERAVLLVPEGLVRPRPRDFVLCVLLPMTGYRMLRSEWLLRRLLSNLTALPPTQLRPAMIDAIGCVFANVKAGAELAPLFDADDFAKLKAPVLLVAAGKDVIYPGAPMIERARRVLPTLREPIFLPEAGHVHPSIASAEVMDRVVTFLLEAPAEGS